MNDAAAIRVPVRLGERLHPGGDERLARRATAGEAAAFAAIFSRYQDELYRYCRAILTDPDDAEDALQSTMASALRALPGDRREVALRPWLYRVAHNHAISILRSRRPELGEERLASIPDPRVEARPEARERLRQLIADLDALPERQRAALTMRELSGLGFDEIAEALGVSPAGARQAVYEARLGLQEFEAGREMECEQVRQAISNADRRSLRGRRLRAHLGACAGCREFRGAISRRSADLAALAPPLPAAAAAGLLQSLLGGSGAAGAAGASAAGGGAGVAAALGAGNGAGAALALKSAASLVAVAAVGAGAADLSGIADPPGVGKTERIAPLVPGPERAAQPASPPAVRTEPGASGGHPGFLTRHRPPSHGRAAQPGPGASSRGAHRAGPPAHTGAHGPPAHAGTPAPPAHANDSGPPARAKGSGPPAQAQVPASQAQPQDPGSPAHAASSAPGPAAHSAAGGRPEVAPAVAAAEPPGQSK
jgi:RNA polymerase sigma factor (sigma-70 family)